MRENELYIFDNDEEIDNGDFAELNKLIKYLNSLPKPKITMLNQQRVEEMKFAYTTLSYLLRTTGGEATIEVKEEHMKSFGVIRIEADDLIIRDMKKFAQAIEFADNLEIYPLMNNRIRMALMFYRLTIPIE